jgi:putative spermidine/putrescine transport system substrate-binding protein
MLDRDKGTSTANPAGTSDKSAKKLSRRTLLKGAAAVTGAAAGSDAIRGFPTIWAQEIKDIELRHVGVS